MPSITRRPGAQPGRPATAEAELLAAVRRLLAGGATFTELGVQAICKEAGVARSTFYIHFKDKAALLLGLGAEFTSSSFAIASSWQPQDGPEALADVFSHIVAVYREHAPVRRALAEVAAYDETVRAFWDAELQPFTAGTIALIRLEQDAGRIPADLDPVAVTRIVVPGGERAIVDQVDHGDPAADDAFTRELALTWWHGVYRRPT
ncbi:TetR family transcriptional regulator [Kribbella sandramycini]|uniref:AcrR family transcriptional regulator n=1 Tax=Kribbella sandramycini TaxID=60450 RepID=A0A7Y4KWX9_9ACTN|nr:TetR family transcriptional regulator [Kribbella sandramycini]MBB6567267.1 AcrR family transcriptional regulator [Kribbella sandramycini]NOL40119.1 TetR family transcriptional regulator [Kribbella sandramycini]